MRFLHLAHTLCNVCFLYFARWRSGVCTFDTSNSGRVSWHLVSFTRSMLNCSQTAYDDVQSVTDTMTAAINKNTAQFNRRQKLNVYDRRACSQFIVGAWEEKKTNELKNFALRKSSTERSKTTIYPWKILFDFVFCGTKFDFDFFFRCSICIYTAPNEWMNNGNGFPFRKTPMTEMDLSFFPGSLWFLHTNKRRI